MRGPETKRQEAGSSHRQSWRACMQANGRADAHACKYVYVFSYQKAKGHQRQHVAVEEARKHQLQVPPHHCVCACACGQVGKMRWHTVGPLATRAPLYAGVLTWMSGLLCFRREDVFD